MNSALRGHSACSEFCGSAYAHSLHRMSNTTHSLASHNPQNSSTILECQKGETTANPRIFVHNLSDNLKHEAEGFLMKIKGFVSLRSEIRQSVYRNEQVQQSLQFRKKPTLTKPNLFCISLLALIVLSGCTRIVKEPVYIPTKCEVIMPTLKSKTSDTLTNTKNILIYAEQLECTLDFCIHSEATLEHCKGGL